MLKRNIILLLLLGLAACGGVATKGAPDTSRTVAADASVPGAAIHNVVDPLSPNWQIEEARMGGNRFRISLRKNRFAIGGDGEATQLFYRCAERIVRENGYAGYTVLEFGEGIESIIPIAQRVAQGIIQVK